MTTTSNCYTATKILYGPLQPKRVDVTKIPLHIIYLRPATIETPETLAVEMAFWMRPPGIHYAVAIGQNQSIAFGWQKLLDADIRNRLDAALNNQKEPMPPAGPARGFLGSIAGSSIGFIRREIRDYLYEQQGINPLTHLPGLSPAHIGQSLPVMWGQKFVDLASNVGKRMVDIGDADNGVIHPDLIALTHQP